MLKIVLITTSALALAIAVPSLATAKSIKHLLTPESLAEYCQIAGVDTETTTTVTLPDGSALTGSIHCESEDLPGAVDDDSSDDDVDDDHEDNDDDNEDDDNDSSDSGHSDDDSSDDDHGSDDDPDDNSSDDDSSDDDDSDDESEDD